MKQSYEENIVDIIRSLHELKRLSPSEVLAIYETAKLNGIPVTSQKVIFYEFEKRKEWFDECKSLSLGLAMLDKEPYFYILTDPDEDVHYPNDIIEI